MTTPFYQCLLDRLARSRDDIVLHDGNGGWHGARLLEAVRTYQALLNQHALEPGDRLIWSGDEGGEVLALRIAAMALGCRFFPGGSSYTGAGRAGEGLAIAISPVLFAEKAMDGGSAGKTLRSTDHDVTLVTLRQKLEGARRLAVLSPLSGVGGDLSLAAWGVPAMVRYCDVGQAAGVFAFLESAEVDSLVLSEARLRSLSAHPAALLAGPVSLQSLFIESHVGTDQRELMALLAEGPFQARRTHFLVSSDQQLLTLEEARSRRRQQGRDLELAAIAHPGVSEARALEDDAGIWVLAVVAAECTPVPVREALWRDRVLTSLGGHFADADWRGGVAATERLADIALRSMLNALSHRGVFNTPEAGYSEEQVLACAAERHRPLLRRWLAVLEHQGLLRRDGGQLAVVARTGRYDDAALALAWDEMAVLWRTVTGASGTIDYARENSAVLAQLLAGERKAVEVLFPAGRTERAAALYRESPAARYQHRAVAALLAEIAAPRDANDPLRVLEVGAGTGATSEVVLPALAGKPLHYVYTDVSRFFLDQAAERLDRDPRVTFALYDIDRPPRQQGFSSHQFDVVIGGGVLNAARDTDASVGWLRQLLRPGGWLVITEPTREEFWVMASQAFMLADADDERARSGRTFLDRGQWLRVLDRAGLDRVLDLPPEDHPLAALGHRIFAARTRADRADVRPDEVRHHCQRALGTIVSRVEIVDRLPEPGEDGNFEWARTVGEVK
ncbi:class I SAM-dependent methyltransferase [Alcanivorax sp. 24]|uniref:class I SAM-dependent methyltransferase n=1 Tax=Alcanivorax sp. 24 TaxID=2545266 RepID=UPI00105EAE78|nr:class I SAM-dependent methyltransferase [Alcanivorax sp. 24]